MASGWLYSIRMDKDDKIAYLQAKAKGLSGDALALQVRQFVRQVFESVLHPESAGKTGQTASPNALGLDEGKEKEGIPSSNPLTKESKTEPQEVAPPEGRPVSQPAGGPRPLVSMTELKKREAQEKKNEL